MNNEDLIKELEEQIASVNKLKESLDINKIFEEEYKKLCELIHLTKYKGGVSK